MMHNKWETLTPEQWKDRNGPTLRRIEVPGGWLYLADPSGSDQSPSMVFVHHNDWNEYPSEY